MLLEELFIKLSAKYDPSGMREAEKDVDEVESGVKRLNTALNVLTTAFAAVGAAGITAFTKIDRKLSTLSIKAALTNKEFDQIYRRASGDIAVETGADRMALLEGMQQGHSLDVVGEENIRLARMAAVLHREGVADIRKSMAYSIALSKLGLGTSTEMFEKVFAGSQYGAGDAPEYFPAMGGIGGLGATLGIGVDQLIAALGVHAGPAGSAARAGTQIQSLLNAFLKPNKKAQELFASRLKMSVGDIQDVLAGENGLIEILTLIKDNFDTREFSQIIPDKEGVLALSNLVNNLPKIIDNTLKISQSGGVIDDVDKDSNKNWAKTWDSFTQAINRFLVQFGRPITQMLTPFVVAATGLLQVLADLNEATNGLLMWIPAILGALLALRLAWIAGAAALAFIGKMTGGAGLAGIWAWLGGPALVAAFKTKLLPMILTLASRLGWLAGPIGILIAILSSIGLVSVASESGRAAMAKKDEELEAAINKKRSEFEASMIRLKSTMTWLWDTVTGWVSEKISDAWNGMVEYVRTEWGEKKAQAIENAAKAVVDSVNWLINTTVEVFRTVAHALLNPIDTISNAGLTLGTKIADALSDATSSALDSFGFEKPTSVLLTELQRRHGQLNVLPDGRIQTQDGNILPGYSLAGGMPENGVIPKDTKIEINVNQTIDARGSTDPEQTEEAAKRGAGSAFEEWDNSAPDLYRNAIGFSIGG